MPNNFYFDICSIILIITLFIAIFIRSQFRGRNNMLYFILCLNVLICAVADIFTCLNGSPTFNYFSVYLLFFTKVFIMPLYILYVCSQSGIWHFISSRKHLLFWWLIPVIMEFCVILSNLFHHKVFYIDPVDYTYHFGSHIALLYFINCYYFLFGCFLLIRYHQLCDFKKNILLYLFPPAYVIAVSFRAFYPQVRIELLVSTLMLVIFDTGVQRPEEIINPIVGTMSNNAFIIAAKQAFLTKRPMAVLLLHYNNHLTLRNHLGLFSYNQLLRRLTQKTNQLCKSMQLYPEIYFLDDGTFVLLTEIRHYSELADLGRTLHAYLQEPVKLNHTEVYINVAACIFRCPDEIDTHASFMSFCKTFHNLLPDCTRVNILADYMNNRDFLLRNRIDPIINRAISNNSFEMYYQPIYSIHSDKYVSAEALIRLRDEEFGFVSPGIFIPASEESGAIHQIGDFVLNDVCRFISETDFEALGLEYIEINLSVAQCMEKDLSQKIKSIMEQYNVAPEQINLEITETAVDIDPGTTDYNIAELNNMGITFSLDDYGTGYSNIKRVVSLPLNIVKLDKCLVDEMDNRQMWIIITNTVNMLHKINKKILVEGVETKQAFERFKEIGCDYIQGYYFSKPLPKKDFLEFVREYNTKES